MKKNLSYLLFSYLHEKMLYLFSYKINPYMLNFNKNCVIYNIDILTVAF